MKSRKLLLFFLFLTAAVLRFYKLGVVPPSLNADEAAIGYNAYSILKTGKDEFGEKFPLAFRSFDDYKAPLYIYLTSISESIFGLNDFSVRFMSALAGTFTVCLTYLLVESMLSENRLTDHLKSQWFNTHLSQVPLLSATLLAVSPWHLQFSRSAYEANVSVFFIVLGLLLFFKGLTKPKLFIASGVSFVMSMWTYHTPRIFVPILILCLCILYYKKVIVHKKEVIVSLVISGLLCVPLVMIMFSPTGLVRAKGISSLQDPQIAERSSRWISDDGNSLFARVFHNRRAEAAREVVKGYLVHFDPVFLFLDGAQAKYRAPGVGLMYLWELPFLLLGIYSVMEAKRKWSVLLILWLMLSPVAAAPTLWLPSAVRTIVMLPVVQILTAFGITVTIQNIMKLRRLFRYSGIILLISITVSGFLYYIHQYYVHLPVDFASDWQYGRKEAVREVQRLENTYDKIVVSPSLDQPQIFFLYYLAYDPAEYLRQGGTISGKFDAKENHFGKYYFSPPDRFTNDSSKILYVVSAGEETQNIVKKSEINYPDGTPAFVLYEK